MDGVPRLPCIALEEIYALVQTMKSDELRAAFKIKEKERGSKVALTRLRVKLSKVAKLCKQARKEILVMQKNDETVMEKYGVAEDEQLSKTGGDTVEMCPRCGKEVEVHGGTRKCPLCGTEPFEG